MVVEAKIKKLLKFMILVLTVRIAILYVVILPIGHRVRDYNSNYLISLEEIATKLIKSRKIRLKLL